MACSIVRNSQNQIETVLAENGQPSILFNSIASNALINTEQALDSYKNIFTPNFTFSNHPALLDENAEPTLYYKTPAANLFQSYKEALDATQTGDIQAGVFTSNEVSYNPDSKSDLVIVENTINLNNEEAFQTLFSINSNSNPDTVEGFINKQIRLGNLNESKVLLDGQYQLQGAGHSEGLVRLNSEAVYQDAIKQFGNDNVLRYANSAIKINPNNLNTIEFDGGTINKEQFIKDLKSGKQPTLESRMGKVAVVESAYNIYREKNSLFRDGKVTTEPIQTLTEEQLKNSLKSFLSKIGVNVTSIDDYILRYSEKNGVEPTAEALADISNRVVAFADGQYTVENLSEEVAHFAIEAFQDVETLNRMLTNVHLTNEWRQDAQRYTEIYSKNYSGAQLDEIVRKEILGKILGRKFQENFVETQNTPVEAGFTNLLQELWNNLISRFRALITPSIRQELDAFTDAVANNVLNNNFDDVFSESTLDKSEFLFYSLADKKVSSRLQSYYNSLQKINTNLKKQRSTNIDAPLSSVKGLLENTQQLNNAEAWIAIQQLNAGLREPLNTTVRKVEAALKRFQEGDPNQNKLYLNAETITAIASFSDVKSSIQDMISIIENNVIKDSEGINRQDILSDLRQKIEDINRLEGNERLLNSEGANSVVEAVIAKTGLSQADADIVRTKITQETKDITWFGRTFGQLRLSNNIFLNLLGKIFSDNRTKANIETQTDVTGLLNFIEDNGYNIGKFRNIVETDSDGNHTGSLISGINMGQFLQDLQNTQINILKSILNVEGGKELLKRIPTLTEAQRQQYEQEVNAWKNENIERPFTEAYYEQRESDTAWMNTETKNFLRNLSSQRYRITKKYSPQDIMSDADRIELEALARERKFAKALTDENGNPKEDGTIAWQIAQDLIQADANFAERNKDKIFKLREEFTQTLQAIEQASGNKEALKWVQTNGGIRFSKEFYDALGNKSEDTDAKKEPKIIRRLRDAEVSEEDSYVVDEIAFQLENALNERSDILRKYQKLGNPAETDVPVMSLAAKQRVQELDTEIQKGFQQANQILRRNGVEEVQEAQVETENTVNQSYFDDLLDSGIKQSEIGTIKEADFLYKNISSDDQVNVTKFIRKIEDLQSGTTDNIEPKYARFFQSYFGLSEELSEDEFYDEVVDRLNSPEFKNTAKLEIAYGRTKLYSYYKRFAPKGYSEFVKALNNGDINPSRLVNDRQALQEEYPVTQYVEITPNYTWNENTTENERNENFDANWEGGQYQPKQSKYRNENYYNRFNFDGQGNPTQNLEDFQLLTLMHEANRKVSANYGIITDINKLPQLSKSKVEKLSDAYRVGIGETIKRSYKDTFLNRVDDLDYGVRDENDSQNIIPMKYIYDLEERGDVSLSLGMTFAELLYESNLYREKKNSLASVMALRQQVEEQKFTNGKTGDASNALQMADSFIDFNIYGKTQSKKLEINLLNRYKVDVSRLALVIHRFVQYSSLAFSVPVTLTNFLTGSVNRNFIEARLGQFIQADSNLYAEKEFDLKEAPNLLKETGKINRSSKIYKVLEAGGVIDFRNRLQNSGLGRVAVAFNNLGYEGFLITDQIIKSKVFIATFDDIRAVEGVGFMTYNQYKLRPENSGLTKTEIKNKWNEFRDNSLWNILENEGTEPIKFRRSIVDQYGQEELDRIYQNTLQKAAQTSAIIDGQTTTEEKSLASRDYLLRFVTGMRSFLFLAVNSRLQGKKNLLQSNENVEGSYITGFRYLNNIIKKMIDDRGVTNLISAVKTEWGSLDDVGKTNMKRVMAEFGLFLALLAVTTLTLAGDDEDDAYLYTLASYILLRTTSETKASTATGVVGQVMDVIDKPVIAIGMLKELYKGGFFEEVQSGKYEGTNKLTSLVMKNTVLKQIYNMQDIRGTRDTYRGFNAESLYYLSSEKNTNEFLEYFEPEN